MSAENKRRYTKAVARQQLAWRKRAGAIWGVMRGRSAGSEKGNIQISCHCRPKKQNPKMQRENRGSNLSQGVGGKGAKHPMMSRGRESKVEPPGGSKAVGNNKKKVHTHSGTRLQRKTGQTGTKARYRRGEERPSAAISTPKFTLIISGVYMGSGQRARHRHPG